MTECCGGISLDNPDMKDSALAMGGVPYMIKNCIEDDSNWSRTQCNNSCCGDGGYCIPTQQGGFCHNSEDNRYYRYGIPPSGGTVKETQYLYEVDARRQTSYNHSNDLFSELGASFSSRRDERTYAQAQRDILNKFMENNIRDQDTQYKRSSGYLNNSALTPTTNIIILILVLVVGISIINTVITRNKRWRLKQLFY